MGSSLSIGLSALLAAQKAIEVAGHNIANAATPNYSRRRVSLAAASSGTGGLSSAPAGVTAKTIEAIRDFFADRMLLSQDPLVGASSRRAAALAQVESLFSTDPDTGLGAALDSFFAAFQDLASNPSGGAERQAVVSRALGLAAGFREIGDGLTTLRTDLATQVAGTVGKVDTLTAQIADLNYAIGRATVSGSDANDLIDGRFTALRELAELVPIQTTSDAIGRVEVRSGGIMLVTSAGAAGLGVVAGGSTLEVAIGHSSMSFSPASGELGALLELTGSTIPAYIERLDALAAAVVRKVNQIHATGVGLDGGFTALSGTNLAADPSCALNAAGLPFELEAGAVRVSVTDEATGEVTQTAIAFDPDAGSLADLAAAFDGVDHVRAFVAGGSLRIEAEAGYTFNFANQVATHPGSLGTAAATLTGTPNLAADDTYTFTTDTSQTAGGAGSSGAIGTTAGLRVVVTDASGATIATLDVGEGYEAGQALSLPGGVSVAFAAGDAADGDAFSLELAADADPQGLLGALGLNTLLTGNRASTIGVEARVVEDPGLIAAGCSGAAGDNSNALRLAALQDARLESLGGETLAGGYAQLLASVGLDSAMAQRTEESSALLRDAAESQRDAISGVNQDEEAVNLMRFQQLYGMAARYVQAIEQMLDQLMAL